MRKDPFRQLLTELHASIDRVAEALADRPALSAALQDSARWIPRPESLRPARPRAARAAVAALRPLLYRALDEGVLDARRFDALMLRQVRAARLLGARRPQRRLRARGAQ